MINREELEKMIENSETFYWERNIENKYDILELAYPSIFSNYKLNNDFMTIRDDDYCMEWALYYEDLYKTEYECWRAKTYATREERFEPPTWKEFTRCPHYQFTFKDEDNKFWETEIEIESEHIFIGERDFGKSTKENYEKAVMIARKLFLGEKIDE